MRDLTNTHPVFSKKLRKDFIKCYLSVGHSPEELIKFYGERAKEIIKDKQLEILKDIELHHFKTLHYGSKTEPYYSDESEQLNFSGVYNIQQLTMSEKQILSDLRSEKIKVNPVEINKLRFFYKNK